MRRAGTRHAETKHRKIGGYEIDHWLAAGAARYDILYLGKYGCALREADLRHGRNGAHWDSSAGVGEGMR